MHEMKQSLFDSTQALLQWHEQQNQQLLVQFNVLLDRQHRGPEEESQPPQTSRHIPVVTAEATDGTPDLREVSGSQSSRLVQIPGPFVRRCHFSCVCVCHQRQRLQSPGILSAWLGRLVMHSRAFSALSPAECDYVNCKAKSEASLMLVYSFPRWLLARSVEVAISWSSLTGAGSSLHLRVPRILEQHGVWLALEIGDLEWIKRNLAMKSIYPTDTDGLGETLVSVSESQQLCSNVAILITAQMALGRGRIYVAGFLAQAGSDVHVMDQFGR